MFQPVGEESFSFVGMKEFFRFPTISTTGAQRLLESGCEGYVVSVMNNCY